MTTGPLGQGISSAVGLAIAQAHFAALFNKDGFDLINNYTYVFLGDGCLMEGISSEASSLAGHLQLGNLIAIWDDNRKRHAGPRVILVLIFSADISIDGDTAVAFTENVEQRYLAYGWQVLHVDNGDRYGTLHLYGFRWSDPGSDSDIEAIYNAIVEARKEKSKPTLIRLRTTIGFGSKQQGTHGVHGARAYNPKSLHRDGL